MVGSYLIGRGSQLRWLIVSITTLVIFSAAAIGALAAPYIDDFSPASFSGTVGSFTTGTALEGLSYVGTNIDFTANGSTLSGLATFIGAGHFVLTSRAGGTFMFTSLWVNTLEPLVLSGTGPEPFSINISPGTGTFGPAGGKLVSSVTLESAPAAPDFDIYADNVTVDFADTTKPDVSINQAGGQADPTNGSLINFTVVFNEAIDDTTFTNADVSVGGTATIGLVTVAEIAPNDDTTFSVSIVISGDGTVVPTIPAGGVEDVAGNTNNASTSTDSTVTYDNTEPTDPTPTSSSHAVSDWDNDSTVDIQISGASDAGSSVDGFEIEWDQSATWTPTETKEQEETWIGATFTATSDGDWYFHIATVDNAGNWTSTQHLGPFQIDTTGPTVPTGLNPANGSYTTDTSPLLSWTASTDPGGSGMDNYRIVIAGPASRSTYVSDTDYNPSLGLEGTYTWKIYARDNAGNSSSYTADMMLYIDATKSNATIDQAGGQADPTTASPVVFTAVFDEPINEVTFTDADVTIGGTAATGAVTVTEIAPNDDTTFSVSVVMTGDGMVTADIGAGVVEDFAGNTNTVSTSTDNTVMYDGSKPDVTIDQAVGQADPTNVFPLTFTAVFSEPINAGTFSSGDATLGGSYLVAQVGTISEIAPNDGTTFSIEVNDLIHLTDGTITASIGAGLVEDLVGNTNNASTSGDNEVTVDTDPPGLVSVTPNAAYDADVGVVSVSITFDEPMDTSVNPSPTITGLTTDPYTITGSAWSNGDLTWTGTFTLLDDNEQATGDYNVSGFKDLVGNTMVPNSSKSIEVDTNSPTILSVDASDLAITDVDAGGGLFRIITVFDQTMDTAVTPVILFDPDVTVFGSATLIPSLSFWSDTNILNDTFTMCYSEVDAGIDVNSVVVSVQGAADSNGNPQEGYVAAGEFQIDTLNPALSSIVVSDTFIESIDVGEVFSVTVSFSETMLTDGSADPGFSFDPNIDTTLSATGGTWLDTTTYEATYDMLDGNVIEIGVDVNVGGVQDEHGNLLAASYDALDQFDIDTLTPMPSEVPDIVIVPMGAAGEESFLDRCLDLAEGEEPPMVGLRPLTAIYEEGEVVSGACRILNPAGHPVRGSYIHVYIYSVDIEPRPEVKTLLDHWTVNQYDSERGGYSYSWDTSGYAPGYYDIYLSFADGSSHTCRIQLTEPME